jgi:hypothetical protein
LNLRLGEASTGRRSLTENRLSHAAPTLLGHAL